MLLNNAKSVFEHIEKIAATSSKLEKEALVKQGMSIPMFVRVVRAAYDPHTTYFIEAVPEKTPGIAPGANTLDESTPWDVLKVLADRTLSGDSARNKVQQLIDFLDDVSSELFRRILKKDLRAGFTDGTVNRVAPGTFPEYPYMRCSLPEKSNIDNWDWAAGIFSQLKADGMFANVNVHQGGVVELRSRQGSLFPLQAMVELVADMVAYLKPGTQSHGELIVQQGGKDLDRKTSNGIMNSLLDGGALEPGQRVAFYAWDQIPLEAVAAGVYNVPYTRRFKDLMGQVVFTDTSGAPTRPRLVKIIPTRLVRSKQSGQAHFAEVLKQGKEGVIWKNPQAIWKDGTSKDQVKGKLEVQVELRVKGFNPGTGKNKGKISSLQCASECGVLEVDVTCRGDAMIDGVTADPESWREAVITVKANDVIDSKGKPGKKALFLPVFIERRTDKTVADTLAQIEDQFNAAKGLAPLAEAA